MPSDSRRPSDRPATRVPLRLLPLFGLGLALGLLVLAAGPAQAGLPGPSGFSDTIGLSVSTSNLDLENRTADFDFVAYTRYAYGTTGPGTLDAAVDKLAYPSFYLGAPFAGLPAIDYGDGSTVPTITLGLTSSGGGPGGTNVYRSLASLTHTYPTNQEFTATAAMTCQLCFYSQYVFFTPGTPPPPTFTGTFDYLPTQVIGNLAATTRYTGTTYLSFLSTSVRYMFTYYQAVTNTAPVDLLPIAAEIPVLDPSTLALLGALLAGGGLWLLRRG